MIDPAIPAQPGSVLLVPRADVVRRLDDYHTGQGTAPALDELFHEFVIVGWRLVGVAHAVPVLLGPAQLSNRCSYKFDIKGVIRFADIAGTIIARHEVLARAMPDDP